MSESEGLLEREYRSERLLSRREFLRVGVGRFSVNSEPMGSSGRKPKEGFPKGLLSMLRTAKKKSNVRYAKHSDPFNQTGLVHCQYQFMDRPSRAWKCRLNILSNSSSLATKTRRLTLIYCSEAADLCQLVNADAPIRPSLMGPI